MRIVAEGLQFPEGPIWMQDDSLVVVEIRRGTLTRIWGEGRKEIIADLGGGPNGAAIGPDGACYVCNNGGFNFVEENGVWLIRGQSLDYAGGRIERVDLETGTFERVYDRCGSASLNGPNDLVFDSHGGFYFTDLGKQRARDYDVGAVYYATPDGQKINEVISPILHPNGVGLSPDGRWLYVSETHTGRLYRWEIVAPGSVSKSADRTTSPPHGGELLFTPSRYQLFDSLAVEAGGAICIGTLAQGGITIVYPDGSLPDFVPIPRDSYITNICFGGQDLRRAFLTCSHTGVVVEMEWPRPGLRLAFVG
jgi:gluconolactonase